MSDITGTIFDIKQMAVFDGPGIRTTVFLKGCPLRCAWCHNPEGLEFQPQLMVSPNGCIQCGKCKEVCQGNENCILCGECVRVCPLHLRKICGVEYTVEELAKKLLRDKEVLEMNDGGVTFSGGEPTNQPLFLLEVLKKIRGMHRAIETCGYCAPDIFQKILNELEYVIMDLKMIDSEEHKKWTKKDNKVILQNLELLKQKNIPFLIRIPLIPGVNDTEKNYRETAEILADAKHLQGVELLPYHRTAGAKYSMVGKEYEVDFKEDAHINTNIDIFQVYGISAKIL